MSESAAPQFSILTAVYETQPEHLDACLASVDAQTEASWEHVLVDDGSTRPGLDEVFATHADPRRRVIRRTQNGGIVAASDPALEWEETVEKTRTIGQVL